MTVKISLKHVCLNELTGSVNKCKSMRKLLQIDHTHIVKGRWQSHHVSVAFKQTQIIAI